MSFIEILKAILFGMVEGYTEFLPISSTGHLILVENLVHLDQPEEFFNVFKVVVQLGAILSVVVLYWKKLWPFAKGMADDKKRDTLDLWIKIFIACLPAAAVGLLLDNVIDAYLSTPAVIATALIFYGAAFILLESRQKSMDFPIRSTGQITYRTALFIGFFQCLSLIPGTSRSGATILGAMLLGTGRSVSAEFSFFLGLPVIFGASLLKLIKHGFTFTGAQVFILILGMAVSFFVALYTVRYLISYIKRHDFRLFGWYRIILGIIVAVYFGLIAK